VSDEPRTLQVRGNRQAETRDDQEKGDVVTECPYAELRGYLSKIGAPSDAMEHITKALGWRPPPKWEAPHEEADAINQTVETPEGMRHVGWYCEHPMSRKPPYERLTEHRERANNKRGWKLKRNTGKALSFGDYDMEIGCPQRVPIFIKDAS
jgi:hypothetical protein